MYCWKCGKENGNGSNRCITCGADLLHPGGEESLQDQGKIETVHRFALRRRKGSRGKEEASTESGRDEAAKPHRKRKTWLIIILLFVFLVVSFGISLILHPYYWSAVLEKLYPTPDSHYGTLTPTPGPGEWKPTPSPIPADWELVTFGRYEQDNISVNGPDAIEWIVLNRQGSKALLLSRYALDCQPYNTRNRKVTWETCTLRKWLNETFLNEAFSPEEQEKILTVTVSADKARYSADPGNATQDRIFLLSCAEANQFFASDPERICAPTAYALAQGLSVWGWNDNGCEWLLRTPTETRRETMFVGSDGYIFSFSGYSVKDADHGIRPALWVDLG